MRALAGSDLDLRRMAGAPWRRPRLWPCAGRSTQPRAVARGPGAAPWRPGRCGPGHNLQEVRGGMVLVVLLLSGHSGLHGTLGIFPAAARWALLMSAHSSGQELRVLRPMGAWQPVSPTT